MNGEGKVYLSQELKETRCLHKYLEQYLVYLLLPVLLYTIISLMCCITLSPASTWIHLPLRNMVLALKIPTPQCLWQFLMQHLQGTSCRGEGITFLNVFT